MENVIMGTQLRENKIAVDEINQDWRGVYRVSSILLIFTAVVWTVVSRTVSILYASGYPSDPASYLELISHHQRLATITWSLWIVSDFLLMLPTIALYVVLR